jgi:hypothetical protein
MVQKHGQAKPFVPVPQILQVTSVADLADCANGSPTYSGASETSVFAGQQILLCILPPPAGFQILSQSWSFDNILDITGGFTNAIGNGGQPSAANGGMEAEDPSLTVSSLEFYFVNPNTTETATYSWTLNTGTSQTTADFQINGPTGNLLPNAFAQSNNTGTSLSNAQNISAALMSMTNSPLKSGVGVFLSDNAEPVSNGAQCPPMPGKAPAAGCGQFIWVQILESVTQSLVIPSGDTSTPNNASSQLDGTYPYFNGPNYSNATWDSPGLGLLHDWGEGAESFNATMYVLWDPALPVGCIPAWTDTQTTPYYTPHASTCTSIPIPLGSVQWGWSACAINALAPAAGSGTTPSWFLQCGTGSGNSSGVASEYPQ